MLQSPHEEVRLLGLKAVASSGQADLGFVCRALGDESWRVRKEAVEMFLQTPGSGELAGEIIDLLHSEENAGLRNAAAEILVRLGSRSVPFLIEELACTDHDVRKFALDILGDIGDESCVEAMLLALSDEDENVRSAAAENLGKLRASVAVPALLDTMQNADLWMRFTILEALARIGQAVPVARLLAFTGERLLRKALFDCFGRLGGIDAIPVLIQGLTDTMRNVREAAILALDSIAGESPEAVAEALSVLSGTPGADAVAVALESPDPTLSLAAVRLLRDIRDLRYAPRLLALFENESMREEAARALLAMGRSAACALMRLWPEADSRTKISLAFILGEAGCVEGFALLCDGLRAGDAELQLVSAQSLGKLGNADAISPLVEILCSAGDEARAAAMQALCRLGRKHPEEVHRNLRPLLESEDPELRMHVVSIFGQLEIPDVESPLAFAMKDESPLVRRAAVRMCESRSCSNQLPMLMLALTDEDAEVRRLAAESLGMVANRQAITSLELALEDEDIWVRAAAVRSLGRLGGDEVSALIRKALQDPVGLVAISALETLAELDCEEAYPAIVQSLSHSDEEVVNAGLTLLAASGRRDWLSGAAESLINHRHWEVRSTFIRAIAALEGIACRRRLEDRLLLEGEELVRQLIQDILAEFREAQG